MKMLVLQVLVQSLASVIIGALIGSERARQGRAAGMRTHILVCLGSCMTSMTSMYVADFLGYGGDVLRIPAQVISGIGFLGAGMIILKSNNIITGLTTAAGVWTTATIGIAIGYGFYIGAVVVTVMFLVTIVLFGKFERSKRNAEAIYLEIDNMYAVNAVIREMQSKIPEGFSYSIFTPKSGYAGNIGVNLVTHQKDGINISALCEIEHIAFAVEE